MLGSNLIHDVLAGQSLQAEAFSPSKQTKHMFPHLQVFLGQSGGLDAEGNELPRLVYVSREKRPGFQHHKKAGAMNALVGGLAANI